MNVSATTKQMASGRMVDLAKLRWTDVDFERDIAPALARLCRFDGAMTCLPYSVAQHCVLMADAALSETGSVSLAAACLLHDAHEAYLGDLTVPAAALISQSFADALADDDVARFRAVLHDIKSRMDGPILDAAGVPTPESIVIRKLHGGDGRRVSEIVADYDLRMLATERRQLLAPSESPWDIDGLDIEPIRMAGAIRPWPIAKAEMEWLDRLAELCPNHHVAAAPKARTAA